MICAKNYETMFKFVKVMWPLFSGHGVFVLESHADIFRDRN